MKFSEILAYLCPIYHPTILFNRKSLIGYSPRPYCEHGSGYPEDYDLWFRLSIHGLHFDTIDIPLYYYRLHPNQITRRYGHKLTLHARVLQCIYRKTKYNINCSDPVESFILFLCQERPPLAIIYNHLRIFHFNPPEFWPNIFLLLKIIRYFPLFSVYCPLLIALYLKRLFIVLTGPTT